MSKLESVLEDVAKHVLSIDEFNFEVRNLKVIISPKLKNERTEEDLVYFLQDAIYREANEINNLYKGEGYRSLQLDFNGKDAIYVNFNSVPKIDNKSKELFDDNLKKLDSYLDEVHKYTSNDKLFDQSQNKVQVGTISGQKIANFLWDNAMSSMKGDN